MSKIKIMLLVLAVTVLTGCTRQTPADLLLAPPYGNEDDALTAAIRKALPPKGLLSLPSREKSLNAVRKADLDGDGIEEAVVTYKNDVEEQKVMLLQQAEGSWSEWLTLEVSSYEAFDWVDIDNLDDDETPELLIGYQSYDNNSLMLDIYKLSNPKFRQPAAEPPTPVASLPYSLAATGDVNGDGKTEIVTVTQYEQAQGVEPELDSTPKPKAEASVYWFEQNQIVKIAEMELNGNVNYYDLKVGKVSQNRYGLLLEASMGLRSSISYVFEWENEGKFKSIYPEAGTPYINAAGTLGRDSNGDGILEIGTLQEAPGQDPEMPFMELLYFEERLQWNGKDDFDVVARSYSDYQYGFSYSIPAMWENQITLSRPEMESAGVIDIEIYEAKTGQRSVLFTIYAVPYGEWEKTEQKWQDTKVRYVKLRTALGFVYAAVYGEPPEGMAAAEQEKFKKMQQPAEDLIKNFKVIAPD